MELSSPKSKRVRPLMGTYFGITLDNGKDADEFFELAQKLEREVSFFQTQSSISLLNSLAVNESVSVSPFFATLFQQALWLRELSETAFEPMLEGEPRNVEIVDSSVFRKAGPFRIDLNGIAKGAIVDEVVSAIEARYPGCKAIVNAGGDMRFTGMGPHVVQVRMGPPDQPLARSLTFMRASVATSSPALSLSRTDSTTVYRSQLTRGEGFAVTVGANDCATADALTKVGLFAKPSVLDAIAEQLKASIYVFDSGGTLVECYGTP